VQEAEAARRLAAAVQRTGTALVVHTMHARADAPAIEALTSAGVAVFDRLDTAVRALGHLPAPPRAPRRIAAAAPDLELGPCPAYHEARALLAACGVPLTDGALARTPAGAAAIAHDLGGPVALKAVAADLSHKTEAGAVELDVHPSATEEVAAALLDRLRADGVFVERMAPPGVDLLVGARRDPSFGPIVLVGAGGIHAEALDDVAVTLAPAEAGHVTRLLRGLRLAPLLLGARGGPPLDVAAVARVAVALGDLVCARGDLDDVEINPLRALPEGVLALDARVVVSSGRPASLDSRGSAWLIGRHP
jgi:acetyltransferase